MGTHYSVNTHHLAKVYPSMGKSFLPVEILNGWKEKGKQWKGFKLMADSLFLNFFFSAWILLCCFLTCFSVVLYSLSCGSIPGAKCECTTSKCQQWKLVRKWGKITRGISEAWDKGRKHINTALAEQQVPS